MKFGYIILCFAIISLSFNSKRSDTLPKVKIEWVKDLNGDFSFKEKWSYPEGIYKNSFNQLSCDGFCPIEVDKMKDENGRIFDDSLASLYKLIDTTHLAYSLQSKNRMYEYSGTDFIIFKTVNNQIIGQSLNNVSTHSSLNISLENEVCMAWVDFNSITNLGQHTFPLTHGAIKIDQALFKKGIIKASFNFHFKNDLNPNEKLFWEGQIYSIIQN